MAITLKVDTYITVADANTYLTGAGLDELDSTDDEKFLKQATKAIDRRYAPRWLGVKSLSTQSLNWPRFITNQFAYYQYNAFGDLMSWNSESIPTELGEATAELALMLQNGFDPYAPIAPAITEASEKVDVIQTTYKFDKAFIDLSDEWTKIDLILAPLLGSAKGQGSLTMVRGA